MVVDPGNLVAGRTGNPELTGLVLAGGHSSRMGIDKASIAYRGDARPQLHVTAELVGEVCGNVYVSVNAAQSRAPLFADLRCIVDAVADRGPAGGLLSAVEAHPDAAWLVLAVDMPRVTAGMLRALIQRRQPERIATVFRHADGAIEPLCAIWEPCCADALRAEIEGGRASLRALAEEHSAAVAHLPEPERLCNANTPEERLQMQSNIAGSSPGSASRRQRS